MSSPSSPREFQVVLLGATGFTGKLVARYLASHPTSPTWAIAGRSPSRLASLRTSLSLPSSVEAIHADLGDEASLRAMCKRASCVISTAGPFRKLGAERVVRICAEEGTGWTDLSGETAFNESVLRYDAQARKTGAVLVPSTGFDCLPFDLGAYLAAQQLKSQGAKEVEGVTVAVRMDGGVSSGTLQSGIDMAETDGSMMRMVKPYWLSSQVGPDVLRFSPSLPAPQFGRGVYCGTFPMSPHNVRVAYQTWSLLERTPGAEAKRFGKNYVYRDGIAFGGWLKTYVASWMSYASVLALLYLPPVRWIMKRLLKEGAGPSDKGWMDLRAVARGDSQASICNLSFKGNPGYLVTARMIAEVGLLISQQRADMPGWTQQGGVFTSATIGGEVLAERLRKYAGFTIECERWEEKKGK